ncbi:MAG: hypothetical protein LLG04_07930 [Parachlamydia sp.]|nr:hypothetical protein [Parachlamydia sp.]
MKGLFYSQFALIAEPPVLSLSLCKRLIQEIDLDFLYGSPVPRHLLADPHFHLLTMPPLDLNVKDLQQHNEQHEKRIAFLEKEVKPPYSFFITEIFPFGKIFLREEILFLKTWLKRLEPAMRMVCSLPDTIEIVKPSLQEKALRLFQEHFDAVFVHSDPNLIRLEDSFPAAASIRDKIIYTGFVPNSLEPASLETKRGKSILIPISWQFFGEELVRAILPVMSQFLDYEFVFVLPRTAPAFLGEILQAWQKQHNGSAMRILPPQKSLDKLLRESALSISLANAHLIDMLHARTPGIAFAAGSPMQQIRLLSFAAKGLVKTMTPNDLVPARLQELIREALAMPYPEHQYDTNGAECTLKELLKEPQL